MKYKATWEWLYQHQSDKGRAVMDNVIFTLKTSEK
jgi:hypothetical protein